VREPMLLRHTRVDRHFDIHLAGFDPCQPRTKRGHESLTIEALANAVLD